MTKHTEGPWIAQAESTKGQIVEYSIEGRTGLIATVHVTVDNDDQDAANASLIASAPDMLAALQDAEIWMQRITDEVLDGEGSRDRYIADCATVRAAIARATKGE